MLTYFTHRGDNAKVSLSVWRTRYTDTFCNAVDCRFELALEVQRWTRARSECLPGGRNYSGIVTPLSVCGSIVVWWRCDRFLAFDGHLMDITYNLSIFKMVAVRHRGILK